MKSFLAALTFLILTSVLAFSGENLKLNPNLDFNSDSQDGPLISGDKMEAGLVPGKPAYVIMYGEACYNSKRQARRTVDLYGKYKGEVQFVIIDIDGYLSHPQQQLKKQYFQGRIPHVMVFDRSGGVVYNRSGEVDAAVISRLLDQALR